jgi:ribonuclease P protein component
VVFFFNAVLQVLREDGMRSTVPIKKNYEFVRLYKNGKFYVGKFLVLYVLPNKLNNKRLGITVSKKQGKSVTRNRIRRLIRENYRLFEGYVLNGFDLVFAARTADKVPDFQDVRKEMKFLLKRLGVFDREKWDC